MRALQRQVAHVLNPAVLGGFVLAIRRRNGYHGLDCESIIEMDIRVFGIILHAIERGRGGCCFSAARMSHQRNARKIHLAVEWIARCLIPLTPQL